MINANNNCQKSAKRQRILHSLPLNNNYVCLFCLFKLCLGIFDLDNSMLVHRLNGRAADNNGLGAFHRGYGHGFVVEKRSYEGIDLGGAVVVINAYVDLLTLVVFCGCAVLIKCNIV